MKFSTKLLLIIFFNLYVLKVYTIDIPKDLIVKVIKESENQNYTRSKNLDLISVKYTGWIFDSNATTNNYCDAKGKMFDSNTTDKFRDNLKNANRLEKGGLSGKPLSIKSDLLIQKFYKNLKGKVKIIGVGGIDSAIDVISKLRSGANLVQLYTGMVFKGPNIASKINTELGTMIEKEGFKNLNEIVGTK